MLQGNGNFLSAFPSGSVFQFKSRAGSLFRLLPLLLTSSLRYVPLPKGGIPDRRGNSFETLHCKRVQLFPHCAVWKSGSASLVMNRNELLKMPECVPAQAFSFPSPTASLSQAPSLPISPPTPLSPPSVSQFCSKPG